MNFKPLSEAKIIHDFLPALNTKRHNIVIAPYYMNTDAAVKAIEDNTTFHKIYARIFASHKRIKQGIKALQW